VVAESPTCEPSLVTETPDPDACYEGMCEIVAEEIQVRLDLQDRDVDDPAWVTRIAGLAVDALLDSYVVRPRSADESDRRRRPDREDG